MAGAGGGHRNRSEDVTDKQRCDTGAECWGGGQPLHRPHEQSFGRATGQEQCAIWMDIFYWGRRMDIYRDDKNIHGFVQFWSIFLCDNN